MILFMTTPWEIAKRARTRSSHRIHSLPILFLMPHGGCNCRCVMCDIWKANANRHLLTIEDLEQHLKSLRRLRVRRYVLSGGEALMHPNLFTLCGMLKRRWVKISLLSSGLLLRPYAEQIVKSCDDVIVSLDGSPEVHNRIRNVPRAFEKLEEGVARIRELKSSFQITGRCVIQKKNYFDLGRVIDAAKQLGLNRISFLAADVTSPAFNHDTPFANRADVALTPEESKHFELVIKDVLRTHRRDISSRFVAESPEEIRDLLRHFRALNENGTYPAKSCNAPWISTVVEADGTVRPCFFHKAVGNIHEAPLERILNGERAVAFRESLDVSTDPTCRRCVCTRNMRLYERA